MRSIPLIAQRAFVCAGRLLKAGQEFGVRSRVEARVLIATGRANFAPARATETTVAAPADSAPEPAPPAPAANPKSRRTYKRRDMTVEDPS